jgi:hypothetical protein
VRNHDEKRKDMIESVLPSTARTMARAERARLHRRRRRSVNMELTTGSTDPVGRDVRSDVAELIYSRRAADKVAPLERWALAVIDRDPDLRDASVDEQVEYFRQLLPDTKIGRHAVSHVYFALEWRARRPWTGVVSRPTMTAEDVRRLLERDLHAELNRQLKQRHPAPRLLRGLDDVDAFVQAGDVEVARIVRRLLR